MSALAQRRSARPVRVLPSPIEGVDDAAWTEFARAMTVSAVDSVSKAGALGAFGMKPRRLVELGLAEEGVPLRFAPPMTRERFLSDASVQCATFGASMKDYAKRIRSGEIAVGGRGLATALVILHRGGRGALSGKMFTDTQALVERAGGMF